LQFNYACYLIKHIEQANANKLAVTFRSNVCSSPIACKARFCFTFRGGGSLAL